jgi:uncharacterized membrane-anchored protein
MSLNLGYLVATAIFAAVFLGAVFIQIKAQRFHPVIYWFTIIATTTVGTTLADFSDRSLGIGYAGGSAFLLGLLMASFSFGTKPRERWRSKQSATPRPKCFTGSPSCSPKPWARL